MKEYKVQLVSTGSLTQLPDSQKLFGALVYMYSEKYGQDHASKLTKILLNHKNHLSISNVMPWEYLPMPQEYIIDGLSESENDDRSLKEKRAAIKMRSYIRSTDLASVLNQKKRCENVFPYVKLQNTQQLRASIESSFYKIPALDSNLYTVPTVQLVEISRDQKDEEQKRPVHTFCFYLCVDESEIFADLVEMLNEAVREKRTILLGKRTSQGLNTFKFQDVVEQDIRPISGDCWFLNTGMLLPNKIDFGASTLKLFTSERRPFKMTGGWDKNFKRSFISFIAEGSIIFAPDGLADAGKSIESPFNPQRDIVFGNAFLYPLSICHAEEG